MRLGLTVLWRWLLGAPRTLSATEPPSQIRLHLPRSVRQRLALATAPQPGVPEPLALLRVRYASEDARNVIVGVAVLPFAAEAYVEGDAGANFDTRWLTSCANDDMQSNCGVMLVHSHGGSGVPSFSPTDRRTNRDVILPLAVGADTVPYGAMVLSRNAEYAVVTADGALVEAAVAIVPDAAGQLDLSA